jgi:hypothetical protein
MSNFCKTSTNAICIEVVAMNLLVIVDIEFLSSDNKMCFKSTLNGLSICTHSSILLANISIGIKALAIAGH